MGEEGRASDPACGFDGSRWSPKAKEGESTKFVLEHVPEMRRVGVAVGYFSAIGFVDGPRRDRVVGGGDHVEPPEHVEGGDGEVILSGGFPDHFALDEFVGLLPEKDFSKLAVVEAVGDDAVIRR